MPLITIKKSKKVIDAQAGTNLMKALLASDVPVASSCHGDGVCAKCKVQVVDGMQSLSAPNELEAFLIEKFSLTKDQRISCQTTVHGDVVIDTTYW